MSRSKLIRIALEEFLKEHRDRAITESINRYIAKYGAELSEEDEAWIKYGQALAWEELKDDDWGTEAEPKKKRRASSKQPKRKTRGRTK